MISKQLQPPTLALVFGNSSANLGPEVADTNMMDDEQEPDEIDGIADEQVNDNLNQVRFIQADATTYTPYSQMRYVLNAIFKLMKQRVHTYINLRGPQIHELSGRRKDGRYRNLSPLVSMHHYLLPIFWTGMRPRNQSS